MRPFLGLVGDADSPPINLHLPSGAAGIGPLLCFVLKMCIPIPWTFGEKVEESYPFLRVFLLIFYVRHFPEEAPKLLANFLIVLPTFLKRGIRRCQRTCLLFLEYMDYSVTFDLLEGICSCCQFF